MIKQIKIFSALYEWTLRWAEHKFAPRILATLTFCESIFFPIGGVVGYVLGYMMFEPWIQPLIIELGYQARFDKVMTWFSEWGIWVVFLAGFSPVPYKLFTVSAGFLQMAFLPFLLASAISRGLRFFLVAGLIRWGGAAMEKKLRQWIDMRGWGIVILIIVAYLATR